MRIYLNLVLLPVLSLASFAQTPGASSSSDPVAIVAGQAVSEQELMDALGPQQWMQLRKQEYDLKSRALENLIRLKVVQAEAKKRGMTPEALIKQEVDSKIAPPSDAEVEAYFWGQNRAGLRFEDVKEQFRANLKQLKTQKARQEYADTLRAKTDVAVLLHPPKVDVHYDPARVKGDPNAPVTIVEFADFQCPYCQRSEAALKEVLAKYGSRVKLAWEDFPLSEIHSHAEKAAEAARCAGDQGKYWEYHDSLFADQSKLDEASLTARANTLHLDQATFQSCLDSGKFKSQVEADRQAGIKLGISGTPSYFVNGVFASGVQSVEEFQKLIEEELASRGKSHGF